MLKEETHLPIEVSACQTGDAVGLANEMMDTSEREHAPLSAEKHQEDEERDAGSPLKRHRAEDGQTGRVATVLQNCECCHCPLSVGAKNYCHTCKTLAHLNCSMGCLQSNGWNCLSCWQQNYASCPTCRPDWECNWNKRSTSTTIRHPWIFASSGCTAV